MLAETAKCHRVRPSKCKLAGHRDHGGFKDLGSLLDFLSLGDLKSLEGLLDFLSLGDLEGLENQLGLFVFYLIFVVNSHQVM